ncbi:hypothetical protein GALL_480000 [mine drainage metagenome]|uniref:Uncharacterized protein n=1 Tax=mine drainage metagenome TaxID=410659 RepID=A0A1J5PS24_9ZZZZ
MQRRREQVGQRFGHRHARRRRRVAERQRRAFAHRHRLAARAGEVGQRDRAIGHRHLPWADHGVAVRQPADGAVADADQKALAGHAGVAQHGGRGPVELDAGQIDVGQLDALAAHVAHHARRLAQQHAQRHVDRLLGQQRVVDAQLRLGAGLADDRVGAALARADRGERIERLGRDRQHVALLAFVAPDLARAHAAFLDRHVAQLEARPEPGAVDQLRKRVGQAAGADVVDGQDRVGRAQRAAGVDHFLRAALHFRVAALHRVEIEVLGVGAGGQARRRAAAQPDAHAGAAELHQQAAGAELDLVRVRVGDFADAAGQHDRLVVAPVATGRVLLEHAEHAAQIGTAELVVERRRADRPVEHDLQRAGGVAGFA